MAICPGRSRVYVSIGPSCFGWNYQVYFPCNLEEIWFAVFTASHTAKLNIEHIRFKHLDTFPLIHLVADVANQGCPLYNIQSTCFNNCSKCCENIVIYYGYFGWVAEKVDKLNFHSQWGKTKLNPQLSITWLGRTVQILDGGHCYSYPSPWYRSCA
jgi:hypothetical protein